MNKLFRNILVLSICLIFYNATFTMDIDNGVELYKTMFQFLENNHNDDFNLLCNQIDKLKLHNPEFLRNYANYLKKNYAKDTQDSISTINQDIQNNITQMFIDFIDNKDHAKAIDLLMQDLKLDTDNNFQSIIAADEINSARVNIKKCIKFLTKYELIFKHIEYRKLTTDKIFLIKSICIAIIVGIIAYYKNKAVEPCIAQYTQNLPMPIHHYKQREREMLLDTMHFRCLCELVFSESMIKFYLVAGIIAFIYYRINGTHLKSCNNAPKIETLRDFTQYCEDYLNQQLKMISKKIKIDSMTTNNIDVNTETV